MEKIERVTMPDTSSMDIPNAQIVWAVAVQQGCHEAWRPLFESTRKWAFKIAKRIMLGRLGASSPSDMLEDLMSEVQVRIFQHIDEFDPKIAGWLTWTTWQIRASVGRYISGNSETVRLSYRLQETETKVKNFVIEFEREYGRPPKDHEIIKTLEITRAALKAIRLNGNRSWSLDAPAIKNNSGAGRAGAARVEKIPDTSKPTALEVVIDDESKERVRQAVDRLVQDDPRLGRVIRMRFGFGSEPKKLCEVGEILGVSRERVRQMEIIALSRLNALVEDVGVMEDADDDVTAPRGSRAWLRAKGRCVRCRARRAIAGGEVCSTCKSKLK